MILKESCFKLLLLPLHKHNDADYCACSCMIESLVDISPRASFLLERKSRLLHPTKSSQTRLRLHHPCANPVGYVVIPTAPLLLACLLSAGTSSSNTGMERTASGSGLCWGKIVCMLCIQRTLFDAL